MRLTFYTEIGQSYVVEIDPHMELENIMALLEAESGIPVADQSISIDGHDLSDPRATIAQSGVTEDAVLLLRRKVVVAGRTVEQDAEMIRLRILGDPNLMRELRETQPDVAAAAQNDPARFAVLLRQQRERHEQAELARQREISTLNADPYDVDAQRKIEEAIRMEAVMENLEHAMEYSPESFGRVTMLYIPVEVNGFPVKAFVDSGAQQTIISPECAEQCGIMRLLDTRFSGIAKGVGTAKILGRVHSAQIKLADIHLPCSFTVMEGREVDLLFGLDMLKAHQACIDLEKNVLRIQGREVQFLAEHALPAKARDPNVEIDVHGNALPSPSTGPGSGRAGPSSRPNQFPGGGHSLGQAPASPHRGGGVGGTRLGSRASPAGSRYSERDIETIVSLGVSREVAISTLDAAGGNVDVAASLLF